MTLSSDDSAEFRIPEDAADWMDDIRRATLLIEGQRIALRALTDVSESGGRITSEDQASPEEGSEESLE